MSNKKMSSRPAPLSDDMKTQIEQFVTTLYDKKYPNATALPTQHNDAAASRQTQHGHYIDNEKEHVFHHDSLSYANILLSRLHNGEYLHPDEMAFLKHGLPSSHPINWKMVEHP